MPDKSFKPIFERTLSEQSELIRAQIKRVQTENISCGLYNSYRDSRYKSSGIFVRRYKDHREVIKIDSLTGHAQTIKTIL